MDIPFVDVRSQTITAALAVRSVPEAVTPSVVVILGSVMVVAPKFGFRGKLSRMWFEPESQWGDLIRLWGLSAGEVQILGEWH